MADTWNNWQRVADALIPACKEAVSTTAKAGKAHVQENITANGQVLTGNMLKSVYASTPEGSDYQSGIDRGLPEIRPSSDTEAVIAVSADYAIFPEMGTVFQSGHPFFEPGIAQTAKDFDAALKVVAVKLEDAAK
jgi:HK97 gp10 family phage protein